METLDPFRYKDCETVKPLRRLGIAFLDLFLLAILSVFLFSIADIIGNATKASKDIASDANASALHLKKMIVEADVGELDENENLKSLEQLSKEYVLDLTYGTLVSHGHEDLSSTIYAYALPADESNDHVYRYYVTFKESHSSEFSSMGEIHGKESYLSALKANVPEDYEEGEYPLLKEDIALAIDEYYRNDSFSSGAAIHQRIQNNYKSLLDQATKEFQKTYLPYQEEEANYRTIASRSYLIKYIELSISYLLAIGIHFVLIPILFKRGVPFSYRLFGTARLDHNGKVIGIGRTFAYSGMGLLTHMIAVSLIPLLFYGANGVSLWMNGPFSLMVVSIISIGLLLASFLTSLLERKKGRSLLELMTGSYLADVRGKGI